MLEPIGEPHILSSAPSPVVEHMGEACPARRMENRHADPGSELCEAVRVGATVEKVEAVKPSQLVFLVPAGLLVGTYNIEVRARIGGGTERRIGRLDPVLTV